MSTCTVQDEFIKEARKFFYARRTKFRKRSRSDLLAGHWGAWTKLGAGHYGEAWEHADYPGTVIKISGPSAWGCRYRGAIISWIPGDSIEPRNDVWPEFAEHCMKNPHKNLPRIMHLERVGRLVWGVMPKYAPNDGHAHHTEPAEALRRAVSERRTEDYWVLPLLRMSCKANVSLDLHEGNVMYDPENWEPVIIDPFSSTGNYGTRQYNEFTTDEYSSTIQGDETC